MVLEAFPEPREPRPAERRGGDPPSWLGGEPRRSAAEACAFCGESAPAGSSFCPHCGRALTKALRPGRGESLTVVFTDIEDSTLLNERLGDGAWEAVLDEHNGIVREELQAHGGFEVKLTGDGFLIVYSDHLQAAASAARTQARVALRAAAGGASWPVRIRVGMHSGDVIMRPDGDILGKTVNAASRILAKGRGGQIIASADFAAGLRDSDAAGFFEDAGTRRIRGMSKRMRLYEFAWARYLRSLPRALLAAETAGTRGSAFDPHDPVLDAVAAKA